MERSTMLLMGKSTISMVIFHSFLLVYQRVVITRGYRIQPSLKPAETLRIKCNRYADQPEDVPI